MPAGRAPPAARRAGRPASPSARASGESRSSAFCSAICEPDAPLAAGIGDDFDALPRLCGQHFGERRVVERVRHDDRRRHRPLDVVLLEERRHDVGQLRRASACCGKNVRSPTWRPPRIITTLTATSPRSAAAATTSMSPAVALSTNCRACSCVSRVILSRRRAARSNSSAALASSICACSCASTSPAFPCRNSVALCTSSR